MGVVCEAVHLGIGRRVAVKLVARALRTELMAQRFRREVRAVSAIESDHIVQVLDVGMDERFGLYMVMEYLTGEDLQSRLLRVKRLEPREAARIAQQIARGLAKAHAANIVHRDLKPANVFLVDREDGGVQVKLLDFGISKLLKDKDAGADDTWGGELTEYGIPVGTAQYMSPEQAEADGDVDQRTDVWALGAVLYEMLAGVPAYPPAKNSAQTMIRVMTVKPEPLAHIAPWVPSALATVVDEAMEHDLERRLPDAATFVARLAEVTGERASGPPKASFPRERPSRPSGFTAPPQEDDTTAAATKPYFVPPTPEQIAAVLPAAPITPAPASAPAPRPTARKRGNARGVAALVLGLGALVVAFLVGRETSGQLSNTAPSPAIEHTVAPASFVAPTAAPPPLRGR
jgi:serine/threonine-protein kinase